MEALRFLAAFIVCDSTPLSYRASYGVLWSESEVE